MKKTILISSISGLVVGTSIAIFASIVIYKPTQQVSHESNTVHQEYIPATVVQNLLKEPKEPIKTFTASTSVMHEGVPFTTQAPNGDWTNLIFQDGCEEASVMMAMKWVRGETTITEIEAIEEIQALALFQEKNYGDYHDRSAEDTTQMIKDYYDYHKVEFRADIHTSHIIEELNNGNIVIVPTNGQTLNNIYFTPPGPPKHMLVVVGYDAETKEFITNDPGTRNGKDYRYPEAVFEEALRDFPTGVNLPVLETKKNMIVISR
jgi:hypothetical protein